MARIPRNKPNIPYRIKTRNTNKPRGIINSEPSEILFCLSTLPLIPEARYIWMDNEIWDDTLFWIG